MHLSEGILSGPILLAGGVFAVMGTAIGLRKIDQERIMTTALLSAAFFVASLVHVPIGPGSVHLLLNGLMALLLGWGCFPAILVALSLQAIFFQFGGFTVLGVNVVIIAGSALVGSFFFRPWLGDPKKRAVAGFLAGFLSVACAALFMALALVTTDQNFLVTARLVFLAHLPVMVVEGMITMFVVSFLARVQPEILGLDQHKRVGEG
ncbi:MAG: cobalt transporter CbiM [Proteobacteria bacterium]|nr:cobalt transporter CbiM [Pseudomonadota bacterium]MBU1640280.1 cobalt transporter CbiM [Pseudomonadota bacterium]